MSYQPIENYGIIGNMRTVALVGMNGSIDWFCWPHFDSPSIFGAILDDRRGGRYSIAPVEAEGVNHKQLYWPDTNVLVTRFLSAEGVGEVTDFMPVGGSVRGSSHDVHERPLIRSVKVVRGTMSFRLDCRPAFNYGRDKHEVDVSQHGVCFRTRELSMALRARVPLRQVEQGVQADFSLREGESATFLLQQIEDGEACACPPSEEEEDLLFRQTVEYWRRWISQCTYRGRWREMVERSALALKLLTFEPSGAIVAAPTCSLPEGVGGERNWDYRYTWIRDAAFTLYGFLRIGFTDEAAAFMGWLEKTLA